MKITFQDANCKYTGVWQENAEGALVSYGKVTFFEIGFSGENLLLNATAGKYVDYFVDGVQTVPETTENGLMFTAASGEHTLKVKVYKEMHFALNSLEADGFFRVPDRKYIHFIGDSITHAYPGFSSATPEKLGVDYSVVAHCGMSLTDGWGWYEPPKGMEPRMGMESRYFVVKFPADDEAVIPYTFDYCRTPDEIVMFLGTNDYLDTEEDRAAGNIEKFAQHYLAFVKRLRERFPNAPIHMMKPLSDKCCRAEGIEAAYQLISSELPDIRRIDSDTWGVEICGDGTHPSENGYAQLVEGMSKYLA